MRAGRLVEALLSPSALRSVAKSPGVAEVRSPALAIPQAVDEGVALSGADVWHNAGIDGTGVKVAVIDVGFAGYSSLLGTALPASVTTDDRCDGNLATPVADGGTDHGTAVAELVHQMAPGAHLYLMCVDSEVGLALAEQDAAANGVRIINHSVAWFGDGRGDGTGGPGSPDAVVAQARADGILWVNAAGNYAEAHWSGTFTPDPSDPSLNDFGAFQVPYDQVVISSGEQACVILTWDDWPVTTEDFDLYLFRDSDGALVSYSTNNQSGGLSPPEEDLCFKNSAATDAFDIIIANYNAVGSPRMDLYYTGASALTYSANAGSVVDPASSPDALAVGASCWSSPNVEQGLEPYSSYGPTIDGRTKPDLVADDDVSTATFGDSTGACSGGSGFAGTSAAAPQVTGAAALILQKQSSLSVASLTAALKSRALANVSTNPDEGEFQNAGSGLLTLGPADSFGAMAWTDGIGASYMFDGTGAVWTGNSGEDPSFSGDGSRLNLDFGGVLGSMAVDGTDIQVLPGSPNGVAEPVWSPDGSTVASDGVSVFTIATKTTTALAGGTDPEWSPDGSQIAYIASGDVWLMNANGTSTHQLTHLANVNQHVDGDAGRGLSWSPDGSKIAFALKGGSTGIWIVGADGSNAHRITTSGVTPVWSPDGARIAYLDSNGKPPDVYTLDAVDTDGTHETNLYKYGWEYAPVWFSWAPVTVMRDLSPPVLSGTAQVGEALATSTGDWQSSAALTFAYQWYRCDSGGANCAAIPGATAESYTASGDDLGLTLRVEVEATHSTTSISARSHASALVKPTPPSPTAMPTITGTAKPGMSLSVASSGSWSGSVALSYQWLNCDSDGGECVDIPGATSTSYAVTNSDIDDTIRIAVRAVGAGGTSYLSSVPSAVVAAPLPTTTAPPSITGIAAVGHILTATTGSWESLVPIAGYSYRWERCSSAGTSCAAIGGATAASYTLAAADVGNTLRVAVEAANDSGLSSPATSSTTAVVVGLPGAQTQPAVSGRAAVGEPLSATTGSWSWNPAVFRYRWQRCTAAGDGCAPIAGATEATYLLVAADGGHRLIVSVSAANIAGVGTAASEPSSVVVAKPALSRPPSITGLAKLGHRLAAGKGVWTGHPTTYRFQWLRCNSNARTCRAIRAATRSSYRLTRHDLGHRVRLRVTAANAAGSSAATSSASSIVIRR